MKKLMRLMAAVAFLLVVAGGGVSLQAAEYGGYWFIDELPDYTYTGKAITPAVTVRDESGAVVDSSLYTVKYKSNVNVGSAAAYIYRNGIDDINDADGWYDLACFMINPIPASACTVKLSKTSYTYSIAKERKPSVTLTYNGKTLKSSTYSVRYENNVDAGTAKVIVDVNGHDYIEGEVTTTFKIKKQSIKGLVRLTATKWLYTGKRIKPVVTEAYTGNWASEHTNGYENENWVKVTYPKSKKPGKYTLTVKGIGDYTGTVKLSYRIVTKKDVRKACYSDARSKFMSKKQFKKRIEKFLSYNIYCDKADWSEGDPVGIGHSYCSGYTSAIEEFIGHTATKRSYSWDDVRAGDKVCLRAHEFWVVERHGDTLYTIEALGSTFVSTDTCSIKQMKSIKTGKHALDFIVHHVKK